jgi:hypothetical protein
MLPCIKWPLYQRGWSQTRGGVWFSWAGQQRDDRDRVCGRGSDADFANGCSDGGRRLCLVCASYSRSSTSIVSTLQSRSYGAALIADPLSAICLAGHNSRSPVSTGTGWDLPTSPSQCVSLQFSCSENLIQVSDVIMLAGRFRAKACFSLQEIGALASELLSSPSRSNLNVDRR